MKAITVIERDDGGITVVRTSVADWTGDAIRILHRGIEAVADVTTPGEA